MPVEANGAPLSVRIASGQAHLAEERAEDGLRAHGLHRAQAVARQHAAAEVIGHGERIAVLAIAGAELALEVGGPDLIGALRRDRERARDAPTSGAADSCAAGCAARGSH